MATKKKEAGESKGAPMTYTTIRRPNMREIMRRAEAEGTEAEIPADVVTEVEFTPAPEKGGK